MDGICRIVAAPVDVRLGRRDYWLYPLTMFDLGSCEAHLLASRSTPLEDVLSQAPTLSAYPELARDFLRRAYIDTFGDHRRNKILCDELMDWLRKPEGLVFSLWRCLRDDADRRVPLRRISAALKDASADDLREIQRRRDMVSCLDLLASMDWPDEPDEDEEETPEWIQQYRQKKYGYKPKPKAKEKKKSRVIPWRKIVQDMAREPFHMSPAETGKLTLFQLRSLRTDWEKTPTGGGVITVASAAEAGAIKARKVEERKRIEKRADKYVETLFKR